uniref:Uncharacterized protein n=1 Tax=Trypanosoma vivax (strain Y486) TaxID=1055687 RepID=G0TS88_TRYVY|nr:conserved hypothetical protein, fragment [Trypanosoma vivax Y486]
MYRSTTKLCSTIVPPIGKGRVVPLKFNGPKPVIFREASSSNMLPNFVFGFLLVAGAHGGLTGAWPPDPHSLHP